MTWDESKIRIKEIGHESLIISKFMDFISPNHIEFI